MKFQSVDTNIGYEKATSRLSKIIEANRAGLIDSKRNHKVYLHGQKQKCVVLLLHGLFQSPIDQQGLSEHLFKLGCNVIAPLLAGHWEKNESAFQQLKYRDWIEQTQLMSEIASNLGDQLIVIGHSTGGLLAFNFASLAPEKVKALILFAPALRLTTQTVFLSQLGRIFNVKNFKRTLIDHDYDNYKKPALAGFRVQQLNQSIFGTRDENRNELYQNFKTPTLLFSTQDDHVISHRTCVDFKNTKPNLISLITYSQGSGVFHDNIQRGPRDVVPAALKSWVNPFYDSVLIKASDFLLPFLNS